MVSGAQDAVFYTARNGVLAKRRRIAVKTPKYSDNEGFFAARTSSMRGGGAARSGAVREEDKWGVRNVFMKEAVEYLMELQRTYGMEQLFIFAPAYITKGLKNHLPKNMQEIIAKTFQGEYAHHHPFVLLEKIAEKKHEPVVPTSREARKILDK